MTKHTPGAWQWVNPNDDSPYNFDEGGEADLRTVKLYGKNETKLIDGKHYTSFALPEFILSGVSIHSVADARLIAAAPDLLEALESIYNLADYYPDSTAPEFAKIARAAIARHLS